MFSQATSRVPVKSHFRPRYFAFSQISRRILVKSRIPKIPFQTLLGVNENLLFKSIVRWKHHF